MAEKKFVGMAPGSEPRYCRRCQSFDCWERVPSQDIKSQTGETLWLRFRCGKCGSTTLYPAKQGVRK
jgi:RNase P subunit RPR2